MSPLTESYTQLYRNYDKAMVDFIHNNISYPPVLEDARPLICVFATPERAFAQVEKRLAETPDEAQKKYPLAYCSIERVSEEYDPSRVNVVRVRKVASRTDNNAWLNMPWPIPQNISYQINFWGRLLRDIDDLWVQLQMNFHLPGPMTYLTVDHPFPMGEKIVKAMVTESRRLPMIEVAEKQRVMRRAVTIVVDGWLIRDPVEYGRVETLTTEYRDADDVDETDEDEMDNLGDTVQTSQEDGEYVVVDDPDSVQDEAI